MAATLIRWQSRQLLEPARNSDEGEAFDDLRSDLIRQLQVRAKEMAGELAVRCNREAVSWVHPSLADWQDGPAPEEEEEEQPYFSTRDVIAQAEQLRCWVLAHRLEQQERERQAYSVSTEGCTVEGMSRRLREQLMDAEPDQWMAVELLFAQAGSLPCQCSLFLAVLKLARDALALRQIGEFSFALAWRAKEAVAEVRPALCDAHEVLHEFLEDCTACQGDGAVAGNEELQNSALELRHSDVIHSVQKSRN